MALPIRRTEDQGEVTRWDPVAEIERLNRQIANYLESWRQLPSFLGDEFVPIADVEETDDAYVVDLELPGVKKDDVEIEIAGRRLTVTGERRERQRVGIFRRRSRVTGRFRYEITLPGDVDDDHVEANLDEGVLTVRIAKPASQRARRIPIH